MSNVSEAAVRCVCEAFVSTAVRAFYEDDSVALIDVLLREPHYLLECPSSGTASGEDYLYASTTALLGGLGRLSQRRLKQKLEFLRSEGWVECEELVLFAPALASAPHLPSVEEGPSSGEGFNRSRSRTRTKGRRRKVRAWYVDFDRALDVFRLRLRLAKDRLEQSILSLRTSAALVCPNYDRQICNGRYSEEDAASFLVFDVAVGSFLCRECRERYENDPDAPPAKTYALRHEDNSAALREAEAMLRRLDEQMSGRKGLREGVHDLAATARRMQKERGGRLLPSNLPSEMIAREAREGSSSLKLDIIAEESALAHKLAELGLGQQGLRPGWEDAAARCLAAGPHALSDRPNNKAEEEERKDERKNGDPGKSPVRAVGADLMEGLPWFLRDNGDKGGGRDARNMCCAAAPASRVTTGESILTHLTVPEDILEEDPKRLLRLELIRQAKINVSETGDGNNPEEGDNDGSELSFPSSAEDNDDDFSSDDLDDDFSSDASDDLDDDLDDIKWADGSIEPDDGEAPCASATPQRSSQAAKRDVSSSSARSTERKKVRVRSSEGGYGPIGLGGRLTSIEDAFIEDQISAHFQRAVSTSLSPGQYAGEESEEKEGAGERRLTTGEFMEDIAARLGGSFDEKQSLGDGKLTHDRTSVDCGTLEVSPETSMNRKGRELSFASATASAETSPSVGLPVPTRDHSQGEVTLESSGGKGKEDGAKEGVLSTNLPVPRLDAPGEGRMTTDEALDIFAADWKPFGGDEKLPRCRTSTDYVAGEMPLEASGTGSVGKPLLRNPVAVVENTAPLEQPVPTQTHSQGETILVENIPNRSHGVEVPSKLEGQLNVSTSTAGPVLHDSLSNDVTGYPLAALSPGALPEREPRDEDVIFIRGGKSVNHPGNRRFHEEAARLKPEYLSKCTSYQRKIAIRNELINFVRGRGGRFLGKDKKGGFVELDRKQTITKVSQHLRER